MSVIEHQAERVGKYQPYPEYNNSGYSWMAKIPSGWLNGPLKRIAYLQAGFAFKGDTFNTSEGVPIVRMNNILNSGGLSLDDAVRVPEIDVKPEFYLATGDIVMGMSGSIENIAKVQGDDLPCALNQRVGRFVLRAVDDGFLWYLIQSNGFKQQVSLAATGTAQLNISSDQVGNTLVSWPVSLLEQNIIAAFLDYETAHIDRLIAQQQRLIELLKEKRQAVISHAVTKGLNPNAPMKDSGVEWLGQVPEHWEALPIKYVSWFVGTGGTPKDRDSFTDENEINWFTPGDFNGELVLDDSGKYVTKGSILSGDAKIYPAESVLIVGIGATLGKVGVCNFKFSCNQQINIVTPNRKIAVDFLAFSLLAQTEQMKQTSNASTIGIMNQEKTKGIQIAVPPVQEQTSLIIHLKKKLSDFSLTTSKAEQLIALLQERRSALISAAVTGKIDLRGWTPPAEEVAA